MSLHLSTEQDSELARLAYASVQNVPTVEPNDRNRLGYHVWLFLRKEVPTLIDAVTQARSRYVPKNLAVEDVVKHIEERLEQIQKGELAIDASGTLKAH
jgi:cell division septum initiation protein DivIVA